MEAIDEWPRDYELEHEGDEEDVAFYLGLLARMRPRRVMELLAAGTCRINPSSRQARNTPSRPICGRRAARSNRR